MRHCRKGSSLNLHSPFQIASPAKPFVSAAPLQSTTASSFWSLKQTTPIFVHHHSTTISKISKPVQHDRQKDLFKRLYEAETASIPSERQLAAAKIDFAHAAIMDTYNFPDYRLKQTLKDPSKTPLVLVACGSFSPITLLHLRMFVMAGDYVKFGTDFEIVGGYLSPVSDAYKKAGLASAEHR